MDQDWNHEYAKVNGIRIHYVKEGNGSQLVVLLHGWPEFWYSWRNQIKALSSNYTVVAPDLRGFNESDKPEKISEYKQEVVARDVVELIHHLGFEQAVIAGHDWGGAIGWHIALNYPGLVEKFIVMNCPHPGIFVSSIKANPLQLLKSWYMFFFQLPYVPEFIMNIDLEKFFIRAMRGWAGNPSNFTDEVIDRYVEAYKREGALTGGVNYYRANIRAVRSVTQSQGRKVKAPTLMIWGENDKVLGKELTDGTERYIDNSFRIHFIPNCSHWVQNDCPEEVNKAMMAFLAEQ